MQHVPGMSKVVGAGRGTSQKLNPESSQKRKQQNRDFSHDGGPGSALVAQPDKPV